MSAKPLDRLFQQHSHELTGYLARQLNSTDLADDLCQDVYLRLRRGGERQTLDNPRAYLFRIARNLLIDYQRRRYTQPITVAIEDLPLQPASPHCPETAFDHAQCLARLQRILADIPTRQRQAILWHRLDGMTQREIAQRLEVSERMAGRYIQQAVQTCQARLGEQHF